MGFWTKIPQLVKTITKVKPKPSKEARIEWLKKAAKKRRYSKDFYRDYK